MVSFFGLKLGGDKKKKSDKAAEPQAPQQSRKIDQNLLGEGQFFGTNVNKKAVVNGSIRSFSRPGTAYSNRTSTFKATPYVHDTHNLAASSMFDLSNMNHINRVPSFTSLKQSSSEANLRTNFGNGSSTSLGLPPTLGPSPGSSARPSTSHGQRAKPWVNPLDVHFNRSTPTGPKSPLGQYELQLNVDSDGSSLLGDKPENIADAISNQIDNDARAAKALAQRSLSTPDIRAKGSRSPLASSSSYPSPPESDTGDRAVFANSTAPNDRSRSPQLVKAGSTGNRLLSNGVNGPTALPSPPMSQPEDDEERPSWEGRPIIQNVAAKRDTLTVNPGRRQSLSMKIEELERTLVNQQKAHEGAARAAQEAQQQAEQQFPQSERRPSLPFTERGPRSQSPAGMRPPIPHGEGPRPQSPMGRPPRPQSPAGMRGPMGGPRHQSPMGRHPRPQSPAGMRGPRPHSPAGYHGPRPHSPAGMRGPPRGPPPRGPPPRPHSPAGMRGPRPDSPNGMREPMGRPPRPHSPAGHGPRNQSPMGRQRRPESPAGRHPAHGQWPQPPPNAQPPRPFSPAGHAMRSQSPMGRGPRPESPVIKHPIQMQPPAPTPAEAQAPPPRPHSPTGLQAPRSGSPLNHPPRAESPMDPDWRTMSPISQTTINSPLANSYSQGPANRPPTRGRPPRPRPDEYGVPQSERRAPPAGPAKRPPRPKPEEAPPPRVAVPLIDPPKLSPPLRAPEPEREREVSRPPNFARPRPPPLKATPRSLVPPTPTSADWPLPSPTAPQYQQQTGANASPPPLSPTSPPPLSPPLQSPASFTHQPLSPPPRSPARPMRAKPPPLEFSAESYTTADGPGPWTPPLRRPTINGSTDLDQRPTTAGKQGSPSRTVAAEREQFFDKGFDFGLGPSSPVRRPNHGLQSPTGIADHFGTGFI